MISPISLPQGEGLFARGPYRPWVLELDRERGGIYNERQFSKMGVESEKDIPAKEKQAAGHLWVFSENEHPRGPQTHQSEKGEGSEKAGLELRGRG